MDVHCHPPKPGKQGGTWRAGSVALSWRQRARSTRASSSSPRAARAWPRRIHASPYAGTASIVTLKSSIAPAQLHQRVNCPGKVTYKVSTRQHDHLYCQPRASTTPEQQHRHLYCHPKILWRARTSLTYIYIYIYIVNIYIYVYISIATQSQPLHLWANTNISNVMTQPFVSPVQ